MSCEQLEERLATILENISNITNTTNKIRNLKYILVYGMWGVAFPLIVTFSELLMGFKCNQY